MRGNDVGGVGRAASDDTDLLTLRSVGAAFTRVVASISEEQWTWPTPCSEWNVRQVVEHVIGGNWYTGNALQHMTSEASLAAAVEAFVPAVDLKAAATSSTYAQEQRFLEDDTLDTEYSHVSGEHSGAEILRLRLHDMIIHTWDIDKACNGAAATIPKSHVAWAIDELTSPASLSTNRRQLPEPTASDPLHRLLAAFGRTG